MVDHRGNQALNRLLVVLSRSMPMYLSHAAPWVSYNGDGTREALESLVAGQKRSIERLTQLLQSRRHTIDPGEFPMTFTDLHDLSLGFLLHRLVEHQRHDVQAIEHCVGQLHDDVEGHDLAQEVLADARAHLQKLESLTTHAAAK
jgi:hypothetical protein